MGTFVSQPNKHAARVWREATECGRKMRVWTENVSVERECECAQNLLECVVHEYECVRVECAVLSVTVPYLGTARKTPRTGPKKRRSLSPN